MEQGTFVWQSASLAWIWPQAQSSEPGKPAVVAHPCNPNTREPESEGQKFKVTLGYLVTLRLAWNTWGAVLREKKWRYPLLGETVQKLRALVAIVEAWSFVPSTHMRACSQLSVTLFSGKYSTLFWSPWGHSHVNTHMHINKINFNWGYIKREVVFVDVKLGFFF